ncbi:ZIP family metal transporter [Azospirillum sp. CT11-132]|uniref:ZIP family metal transporter n=1 Tax=Azospirillum sp. CT11-132 TaxID=3396317 RepID=UPI0039A5E687
MPVSIQAGLWGLLSGSALLLGAGAAWVANIPQRVIAAVMAFGSGVLISALSFELMEEAIQRGGFIATALGFLGGALVYTLANVAVSKAGGKHRKRSGGQQKAPDSDGDNSGGDNGLAIAIGALLDGIPESIVIGVSLIEGGAVSMVAVIAVFLSNVPEGLSSAAGMRKAGKSAAYIFGLWAGIALISGLAAWLGYVVFAGLGDAVVAATQAVAAGAILAMIADTMIPEAFEATHDYAGFITVAGFLAAFTLSKMGG